jgi:internalin A
VHGDVRAVQAVVASGAADLRRLIAAAGTEVTDCPRLFTVTSTEASGLARLKFHQLHFRLTLWCESPGHWHPCPGASYPLDEDRPWVRSAIRYARPILALLRVAVPAAGLVADVLPEGSRLPSAKEELDRMQDLLDAFPEDLSADDQYVTASGGDNSPATASGTFLRQVRQMLRDVDRYQRFGGARQGSGTIGRVHLALPGPSRRRRRVRAVAGAGRARYT